MAHRKVFRITSKRARIKVFIDERNDPEDYRGDISPTEGIPFELPGISLRVRDLMKNSSAPPKTLHPPYYIVEAAARSNTIITARSPSVVVTRCRIAKL